jgi:hypothetical protein
MLTSMWPTQLGSPHFLLGQIDKMH